MTGTGTKNYLTIATLLTALCPSANEFATIIILRVSPNSQKDALLRREFPVAAYFFYAKNTIVFK